MILFLIECVIISGNATVYHLYSSNAQTYVINEYIEKHCNKYCFYNKETSSNQENIESML